MKTVVLITLLLVVFLFGVPISCQKDQVGEIVIYGKIIDEQSKAGIPDMQIKVDGVTQFGSGRRTEVGNTRTNTDGTFSLSVKSVENVAFYEFFANWESSGHYTEGTDFHGESYLDSITRNKIPMVFESFSIVN